MTMQRIIVFGASNQIGHFLLPNLLQHGSQVWAVSRHAQAAQTGVHCIQGALPDAIPADAGPWDGIISAGPLAALGEWLARHDTPPARALVAVSSMSVISKQASIIASERAMVAGMLASEQSIIQHCQRLGMACTLLRPTMIYGAGLDLNLTPLVHRARRWRWFPLPHGTGLRQPVHAADVAEAARRALFCPEANGKILSIGGGERLLVHEMFARTRANLGMWALPVPIWSWMGALAARVLPAARGPVSRLNQDLIADNTELTRLLGLAPRAFMPTVEMWKASVNHPRFRESGSFRTCR